MTICSNSVIPLIDLLAQTVHACFNTGVIFDWPSPKLLIYRCLISRVLFSKAKVKAKIRDKPEKVRPKTGYVYCFLFVCLFIYLF